MLNRLSTSVPSALETLPLMLRFQRLHLLLQRKGLSNLTAYDVILAAMAGNPASRALISDVVKMRHPHAPIIPMFK